MHNFAYDEPSAFRVDQPDVFMPRAASREIKTANRIAVYFYSWPTSSEEESNSYHSRRPTHTAESGISVRAVPTVYPPVADPRDRDTLGTVATFPCVFRTNQV